jgi:putative transposase
MRCPKIGEYYIQYQEELEKHKIRPSMTDGYDCYQNDLAERINGTLKQKYLIRKTNNKKRIGLPI